jgi:hypothetical protein
LGIAASNVSVRLSSLPGYLDLENVVPVLVQSAISAVHAPSARSLLARAVGDDALEFQHGTANLVADGSVAPLVVNRDGPRLGAVVATTVTVSHCD